MQIEFTDLYGKHYEFKLRDESPTQESSLIIRASVTGRSWGLIRIIRDQCVLWESRDCLIISYEAMHYINKVIKNLAFL